MPCNIEPRFFPADIDLASCVVIAAQQRGQDDWYSAFTVRICLVERDYGTGISANEFNIKAD